MVSKFSVSEPVYNTFMGQEREDLRATMNHWRSEVEKLPENERERGLAFVSNLGSAAYELINSQQVYGADLIEIRKLFKESINQINFTMREVYGPKIEAAHGFKWILPYAQIARREESSSIDLMDEKSGMDQTDLRFARINMPLATRSQSNRQYHCAMAVGQCVLLKKSGEISDIAIQAFENNNTLTCDYITHEKNESGFLEPVGAFVTGTNDPSVCTALFLAAGKEPGIARAEEKKHQELNGMYMNHMLYQ